MPLTAAEVASRVIAERDLNQTRMPALPALPAPAGAVIPYRAVPWLGLAAIIAGVTLFAGGAMFGFIMAGDAIGGRAAAPAPEQAIAAAAPAEPEPAPMPVQLSLGGAVAEVAADPGTIENTPVEMALAVPALDVEALLAAAPVAPPPPPAAPEIAAPATVAPPPMPMASAPPPPASPEKTPGFDPILKAAGGESSATAAVAVTDPWPLPIAPRRPEYVPPAPEPRPLARAARRVKPTPAPTPAPESTPAQNADDSQSFIVRTGTFASRGNADGVVTRLAELGIPAVIKERNASNGVQYMVEVGAFSDRQHARKAASRMAEEGMETLIVRRDDPQVAASDAATEPTAQP